MSDEDVVKLRDVHGLAGLFDQAGDLHFVRARRGIPAGVVGCAGIGQDCRTKDFPGMG